MKEQQARYRQIYKTRNALIVLIGLLMLQENEVKERVVCDDRDHDCEMVGSIVGRVPGGQSASRSTRPGLPWWLRLSLLSRQLGDWLLREQPDQHPDWAGGTQPQRLHPQHERQQHAQAGTFPLRPQGVYSSLTVQLVKNFIYFIHFLF